MGHGSLRRWHASIVTAPAVQGTSLAMVLSSRPTFRGRVGEGSGGGGPARLHSACRPRYDPIKMLAKAFDQARLLEHSWVGPEHFLLAVLADPSVAAEALAELGVSHVRLTEYLRSLSHEPPLSPLDPNTAPSLNPAAYNVMGWVQG